MLIALNGKAGSGKNTVARIIRYLILRDLETPLKLRLEAQGREDYILRRYCVFSTHDFSNVQYDLGLKKYNTKWTELAFADKLKEICSIIFNRAKYNFDSQDFKNETVSKEFWYYQNKMSNKIFNVIPEGEPEHYFVLIKPTYRQMMQKIGTDLFKNNINPNIWIDLLDKQIKKGKHYIITDLRFKDEYNFIKNKTKKNYIVKILNDNVESMNHISENDLNNAEFDYVINNNGSIDDLIKEVRKMLIHFKILKNENNTNTN
jgi:hypothetical protein